MAVSYNKLWKLLVDKKMSKSDLRKKAEISVMELHTAPLYDFSANLLKPERYPLYGIHIRQPQSPTQAFYQFLAKSAKPYMQTLGILWSMCRMQKFGTCITRIDNFWEKIMSEENSYR